MVLKLLGESLKGWSIVAVLLFIFIVLSSINKTVGLWAGRVFVAVIILFVILGILSFFISFDKIFKKKNKKDT